jgi:hypothetical protein
MRFAIALASLGLLLACGDDDAPPTDGGRSDGGRVDAGRDSGRPPLDGGVDGGSDAGPVDGGPVECEPGSTGIAFPSRMFTAEVFAMGGTLDEPVGLAFDAEGALTVANSASFLGGTDPGTVISFDGAGTESAFAMDDLMEGPGYLDWAPASATDFDEALYLGAIDSDAVLKIASDGSAVELFAAAFDPGALLFGAGGDFGDDLYATSREDGDASAPNPYRVYRYASDGTRTAFTVMASAGEVLGARTLVQGPGGALGADLYVGTIEDPGFSPGSADAIYRVASDGSATRIAMDVRAVSLAAPAPGGDFGEFLYAVSTTTIERVDADGNVEPFATGLMTSTGMAFGADGALYLAQPGAHRIVKISACP